MKLLSIITIVISVAILNIHCKDNPISPVDQVKPGSRNYTWTVDTISGPYNPFSSITGTSPSDLWTANSGDANKIFYHFNGMKWSSDLISRPFSPYSIYSVSEKNVWSAGMQGRIWHYDGNQWSQQYQYKENSDTIVFQDIYQISDADIYATGCQDSNQKLWGAIVHYNGHSWKRLTIPKIQTNFIKIRKNVNGKFYILGMTDATERTYQIYEFDGTSLTQITSGSQSNDQLGGIVELGNELHFIIGFDLFRYSNGSMIKEERLSDLPEFMNVGFGRSTKDIFLGMRNGIAHYNGTDTQYLIKTVNNTYVRFGMVFDKDVFIMGRDLYGNNLIYHGRLND